MKQLFKQVNDNINLSDLHDVQKITPQVVKDAAKCLKDGKTDPSIDVTSECFKNCPDILYTLLSYILRSFLIHGHITIFLLLATLVPIIKNKLGSISTLKNYRSIAISSLILKLLDRITLSLFSSKLGLDELQFAYQEGASTSMCTWAVLETVGYFLRNGSDVYTCQTDMTKAFDMVRHSLLFCKLINAGFPKIFIRIFMFIYITYSFCFVE